MLSLTACVGNPRRAAPAAFPAALAGTPIEAPGAAAPGRTAAQARHLMIEKAMSMIGQPYKYGGAAPGGFDCSGLVFYAAAAADIHLPRTASEQRLQGASVSLRDLEPGDLIFMHLARKELHVGIAIDAARFIHAPSAGGSVRIDSISAAPYARGFAGARRIIADR